MTYTMTTKKSTITINTTTGTITGDTYGAKEVIKEEFPGIRWDGTMRAWTMDGAEMQAIIDDHKSYLNRLYGLEEVTTRQTTETAKATNGRCPRCGTYCYGDCTAS